MQLRDLSDAFHWIRQLKKLVDRIYSGALLENSSITDGRMRFIGGQLLIDSGGRLTVIGTLEVNGTTTVTGDFTVSGPWQITGNGEITGDYTVTGKVTQIGDMDIEGNVELKGDMKTVDGGRIIISGDDGDTILTNSKMTFANGSQVASYSTGGLGLVSDDLVMINGGSGIGMLGLDTVTASASGMPINALGITPLGRVFRVIPD